jgi:protein arginine N-methyltransferase 1
LADARRFLAPGGRFLPCRLEVACCGLDLGDETSKSRVIAEARELAALYGLDFGPYVQALADKPLYSAAMRPGTLPSAAGGFRYPILTEQLALCDLDLGQDDLLSPPLRQQLRFTVKAPGTLSGIVVFFRAHLDEVTQLTNSPFGPPTHWGWDVRAFSQAVPVKPGDEVPVRAELQQWLERQALAVELV